MRNIVYSRYGMLNVVGGPVTGKAHADHTIQRHRTAVHDRFTQLVVVQVFNQLRRSFDHCAQQGLTEAVLYRCIAIGVEIMLQHVGHDIHHSVHGLVTREREGILRIENREGREGVNTAPAHFFFGDFIGNHRAVVHFRACSSHSQHCTQRQSPLRSRFALYKVPHVSIIFRTDGNRLGTVQHASAAYGENQVDVILTAQGYTFMYGGQARIRFYAGQFCNHSVSGLQPVNYIVVQAAALDAAAAVHKQHIFAVFRHFGLKCA
ncbi:hypothetical protein D3C75_769250 [compost metagenome]